jgi:hypothetical protein
MTWSKIPMHLNPWAYRISKKNHGWERVVSPLNAFKTMDGREWFLHLILLKPWMRESGFSI